ncbi:MAG TPA: restriction endonuclease, partial [Thermoanaerobaculia bacterium]
MRFLRQFPAYLEFVGKPQDAGDENVAAAAVQGVTPREQIDAAYKALRAALTKELLERVRACSPQF